MGDGQFILEDYLLEQSALPTGFTYPEEFHALLERRLVDLEPWQILGGRALAARHAGLKERYPHWPLVPFAARGDRDDVACWRVGSDAPIVVIHDFASEEYLLRGEFNTLWDWLRTAVEDIVEHEGGDRRAP